MEKLHTIKMIGKGSYGRVYHMRDNNNHDYALKKIDLLHNKDNKGSITELQILKYSNCEYLVKYHYSYIERNSLCIITDLYHRGDLLGIIKKYKNEKNYLKEDLIWKIFLDICLGVYYLHKNNIIHRDLKSANIMISNDYRAFIGDFGVSKILGNYPKTSTQIGTPYYMSPELFQENKYDKKVDIWSLGCILYELIALDNPFVKSKSMHTLCRKITSGNFPKIYSKRYSRDLLKIIDNLLEINPSKRLSIEEIMDLNCVKSILIQYNYKNNTISKEIPVPKMIPNNIIEWKRELNKFSQNKNDLEKKITEKQQKNKYLYNENKSSNIVFSKKQNNEIYVPKKQNNEIYVPKKQNNEIYFPKKQNNEIYFSNNKYQNKLGPINRKNYKISNKQHNYKKNNEMKPLNHQQNEIKKQNYKMKDIQNIYNLRRPVKNRYPSNISDLRNNSKNKYISEVNKINKLTPIDNNKIKNKLFEVQKNIINCRKNINYLEGLKNKYDKNGSNGIFKTYASRDVNTNIEIKIGSKYENVNKKIKK